MACRKNRQTLGSDPKTCDDSASCGCDAKDNSCIIKWKCDNKEEECQNLKKFACNQQESCLWDTKFPFSCANADNVVLANGCGRVSSGPALFRPQDKVKVLRSAVEHIETGRIVPMRQIYFGCDDTESENSFCETLRTWNICSGDQACLKLKDLHSSPFPKAGEMIDCNQFSLPRINIGFENVHLYEGSRVCFYMNYERALKLAMLDREYNDMFLLTAKRLEGWYVGTLKSRDGMDILVSDRFGVSHSLSPYEVYSLEDRWREENSKRKKFSKPPAYPTIYFVASDSHKKELWIGDRVSLEYTEEKIKFGVVVGFNNISGLGLYHLCPSEIVSVRVVTDSEQMYNIPVQLSFSGSNIDLDLTSDSPKVLFMHKQSKYQFTCPFLDKGTTAAGVAGRWGFEEDVKIILENRLSISNVNLNLILINSTTSKDWFFVNDFDESLGSFGRMAPKHGSLCIDSIASPDAIKDMSEKLPKSYEFRWKGKCFQAKKREEEEAHSETLLGCCSMNASYFQGIACPSTLNCFDVQKEYCSKKESVPTMQCFTHAFDANDTATLDAAILEYCNDDSPTDALLPERDSRCECKEDGAVSFYSCSGLEANIGISSDKETTVDNESDKTKSEYDLHLLGILVVIISIAILIIIS